MDQVIWLQQYIKNTNPGLDLKISISLADNHNPDNIINQPGLCSFQFRRGESNFYQKSDVLFTIKSSLTNDKKFKIYIPYLARLQESYIITNSLGNTRINFKTGESEEKNFAWFKGQIIDSIPTEVLSKCIYQKQMAELQVPVFYELIGILLYQPRHIFIDNGTNYLKISRQIDYHRRIDILKFENSTCCAQVSGLYRFYIILTRDDFANPDDLRIMLDGISLAVKNACIFICNEVDETYFTKFLVKFSPIIKTYKLPMDWKLFKFDGDIVVI
ncbi:MAG: hypothetical protein KAS12_01900 [Candidatus Aenigmarchaeota archaeon]|nr:hypothetical protein [Candidatus Aenigmarchaeota archaeon]